MDYIFYSLYYFFSDGGKKDYFCKMSPEDNALFMISLDSAIIISSCIYVLINRAVMWCIIWSILTWVIFLFLIKYYDCQKAIKKMRKKKKMSIWIGHISSILLTVFAMWLWIFDGIEYLCR